jgi:hypothetical protein
LEIYLGFFDEYRATVREVLEQTLDLTTLDEAAPALLANDRKSEVIRYLCGPPLSHADLKMLVRAKSLHSGVSGTASRGIDRVVEIVRAWHDRRRFPWVDEHRPPDEQEKNAAIVATTALLAMRRTETYRRVHGSQAQELVVLGELRRAGFEQTATRRVPTLSVAPAEGQFCRESMLGSRKADFIVGLMDGRTMAIECKVSSSSVNSIKRLNNDAAVKATVWKREFGTMQVTPVAVLDGVYALTNLVAAQDQGLTIFWAHDLASMTEWIQQTTDQVLTIRSVEPALHRGHVSPFS